MLIVYAAVAGQSIVKLYAAAMLPGFFLTFLYLVYILGWAIINPRIAPRLPPDQYRVAGPALPAALERGRSRSVVPGLIAAAFRPAAARAAPATGRSARGPGRTVGAHPADGRHLRRDVVVRRRLQRPRSDRRRPRAGPTPRPRSPPRRRHPGGARRRERGASPGAGGGRGGRGPAGARRGRRAESTADVGQDRGAARGDDLAPRSDGHDLRGQDSRALLSAGSGGWRPSPRCSCSSTSGAWTASSSRSSRS